MHDPQYKQKNPSHGFTLIELLVVIAIIAILAAILFPVFASSQERSRQSKCMANLRQLSFAVLTYASEYGGFPPNPRICTGAPSWEGSPGVSGWPTLRNGQLWKYVRTKGIYVCPTDYKVKPGSCSSPPAGLSWGDFPLSYSMNCAFVGVKWDSSRRVAKKWPVSLDCVRSTKDVMLFIHESRTTINDGDFNWTASDVPSDVHWNGTTLSYVDGHAKWKNAPALRQDKQNGQWNPIPGTTPAV